MARSSRPRATTRSASGIVAPDSSSHTSRHDLGSGALEFADHGRFLLLQPRRPRGRARDLGRCTTSLGHTASRRLPPSGRRRRRPPSPSSTPSWVSSNSSTSAPVRVSARSRPDNTRDRSRSVPTARPSPTLSFPPTSTGIGQASPVVIQAWSVATGRALGPGCSIVTADSSSPPTVLADDTTVALLATQVGSGTGSPSSAAVTRCNPLSGADDARVAPVGFRSAGDRDHSRREARRVAQFRRHHSAPRHDNGNRVRLIRRLRPSPNAC